MAIENPSNPIPLPKEVEIAVQTAKNQVKIAQQEVKNARDIRIAEEYKIKELIKEKEELEFSVSNLLKNRENQEKKRNEIVAENVRISNESKKVSEITSEIKREYTETKNLIESETKKFEEKKTEFLQIKKKAIALSEQTAQKEQKLNIFLTKLNDVLKDYGKY